MSTVFKLKRSSVKGKAPTTSNIELGEIAINTNDGRLFFKTTDSASSSAIVTLREISAGTGITQTGGELKITDTGVVSGSYGSSTEIPILSINAQGQIDSATTVSVAGVSGLAYDSDTNLLTLSTADGGSYSVRIDVNTFTDSDTTDDLPEGSTNQYFTNARVQTHLGAVTGSIIPDTDSAYDLGSSTNKFRDLYLSNSSIYLGNIKIQADEDNNRLVVADSQGNTGTFSYDLSNNTTDDLPEGTTNLYYDSAAVVTAARSALTTSGNALSYNPQTGTITFSEVQYTGFDSDFSQKTTSDLTEGSNLYFTTARARGSVTANTSGTGYGNLSYDTGTGLFTYAKVTDANIRGRFSAGAGITYNSGTGQISSSITQYTDADARGSVSASTSGTGYGNLTYDSSTGIFTYAKVTDANIRGRFSAGTGIGISGSGVISTSITQYTDADARGAISVTDAGGDGSLSYDSGTGILTYTGASASEARAHFSAGGDLSYDSNTGRFSFTERTDAEVRGLVSAVDAGGDGSFSYNSANGQFTYTGPSASETRAHFSGGTGVTITNGSVAIGQSVGTTDDVTFGKVTADSAALDNIALTRRTSAPRPDANLVGGEVFFDSDGGKGLTFITRTQEGATDVSINIGQEEVVYVYNGTGETINNGNTIRFVGAHTDGSPKVEKTLASSPISGPIGMATQDIPDGAHGYITTQGIVRGIDTIRQTTGGPFSVGDRAYICNVQQGGWVKHDIGPDSGYPFELGTVVIADSNDGAIFINPVREHWTRARFSGKVKTSGDLQADGDVTARSIKFDGTVPDYSEGELYYDSSNGAIAFRNDVQGITMQIGQEDWVRVYNNSGSQINNGQPVHVNGVMSNTPTIELADATDAEKVFAIGLATHDIANGAYGYVTTKGVVNDVDTSAYSSGDKIHVGTTAGTLQATAPTFPNYAVDMGYVLTAASADSGGSILVSIVDHTFEVTRTTGDARIDGNLTVAGNVNILGTETKTAVQSLSVGDPFIYVGAGDTITTIFGTGQSGLNDMTFKEYYEGDSDRTYFVKITATDSGGDTIQWGFDSADGIGQFTPLSFDSDGGTGPTSWNLSDDRTLIPLRYNIKATFAAATGHTVGNYWKGDASPVNRDIGIFGNYNTADQAYSHAGIYRDIDDKRWKFVGRYDPEVEGNINTGHSSFEYAEVQATRFHGAVTGDVSGNASTATLLENSRNIGISGHISGTAAAFNGSANVNITNTVIQDGVITNSMIDSSAGIQDFKLATISTAGKVQNGATTATSANTANAIVARDVSGNFTAGTITANLTGNVTGTVSSLSNHTSTIRGLMVAGSGINYDSASGVISTVVAGVDSSATLGLFSVDSSANTGDGSLTYNGAGVFTYVGPSASETRAHFSEGTGISISSGQISTTITQYEDADARSALSGGNTGTGFGSLGYNSSTGAFTFTKVTKANVLSSLQAGTGITLDSSNGTIATTITQYADADARGAISHTNTGTGFGSIGYNSGTGTINYNKVTSANIRSVLSAGGDLSYDSSSGQFSFSETYSTAAELLTALKTVDTNSSGLNADTLDGEQGSHYRINVYNASGTLLN